MGTASLSGPKGLTLGAGRARSRASRILAGSSLPKVSGSNRISKPLMKAETPKITSGKLGRRDLQKSSDLIAAAYNCHKNRFTKSIAERIAIGVVLAWPKSY